MGIFRHSKNYYAILGVGTTATRDQIKTAWRNKVKECHPDRARSYLEKIARTKKLQELNEALEILEDMRKRRDYDTWYQANLQNSISPPPAEKKRQEPSSPTTWSVMGPRVLALFLLSFWLLGTFYLFFDLGGFSIQSTNVVFGGLWILGRFLGSAIATFFLVLGLVIPIVGIVWLFWSMAWDEAKDKSTTKIVKDLIDMPKVIGLFLILGGIGYFLMLVAQSIHGPEWMQVVLGLIAWCLMIGLLSIPIVLIQLISVVVYLVWARKVLRKTEGLMKLSG